MNKFQRRRKKFNLKNWTIVNTEPGFYLPPNGTQDSKTKVLLSPWKQVSISSTFAADNFRTKVLFKALL